MASSFILATAVGLAAAAVGAAVIAARAAAVGCSLWPAAARAVDRSMFAYPYKNMILPFYNAEGLAVS